MQLRFFARTMVLICFLAQPCFADVLITMNIQTDAIEELEVPAAEQTHTTWLGENKMREDSGRKSTIIDIDAKKLFIIDHARRSYFAFDLPLDIMANVPEHMRAELEEMLSSVKIDVEVTPTDESKVINGYQSKKYVISVGGSNIIRQTRNQWMTEDVGFDIGSFKNMMTQLLSIQPVGAEWLQQIWAIDGFPVLAETTLEVSGRQVRTKEELVSIEEKSPAAGTYAPPAGYSEEEFDFLRMMQQQGAGG